jgi:hypothetical protein
MKSILPIFSRLKNRLWKNDLFQDIIFVFDTKTWKDNNKLLIEEFNKKYNIINKWYKWHRNDRPWFDLFKKHFQNLCFFYGFTIMTSDKYEADDVIATKTEELSNLWKSIYILSKDNDLLQLLNDDIYILYWISDISDRIDFDSIQNKYIQKWIYLNNPNDIIYLKTIVWDSSDNIPWIKWVAEKTLAKYFIWKRDIKQTDIYINNKSFIEDLYPVIELNKYISNEYLNIYKRQYSIEKFYQYYDSIEL